jgi:hypothetical protein
MAYASHPLSLQYPISKIALQCASPSAGETTIDVAQVLFVAVFEATIRSRELGCPIFEVAKLAESLQFIY